MNRHLSQRRRSNRWDARSAAGVLWLAIGLTQTLYGADLHVSPRGDDTQAGTPDRSQWLGAAASETSTVDYARAAHQPTGAVHQLDQWHQSFLPYRDPTAALITTMTIQAGQMPASQPTCRRPPRVRDATARCMATPA